jgi:hypothetical protein
MPTLLRKTAKGQAEIETRLHRLTPRLRGLLILVDGKRDLAGLATLVPQQTEALLQELASQGFVEAFETAAAPAEAPATPGAAPATASPAASPAASTTANFEKLRREAVRAFTDVAGPAAETVAIRMEKAKSLDELRPLLAQAAQVLTNMRGRGAAEAFSAKFPSS